MSTAATTPTTTKPLSAPPKRRGSVISRFDLRRDGAKIAAGLVLVLLLNGVVWFTMIRPRQQVIAELSERRTSAERLEMRAEKELIALRGTSEHVESVQENIDMTLAAMATKKQRMVSFQRALNRVGEEFNVKPKRVSIGHAQLEREGIEVMGFTFPLSAGYENLRKFLAALEDLNRADQFLIVREVTLRGAREGGRSLQLNVVVETYFNAPDMKTRLERERKMLEQRRRRESRQRR